jgi:Phage integrase, N-terminal SAM-like domain
MGVPSQPAQQRQPCLRPLRLDHPGRYTLLRHQPFPADPQVSSIAPDPARGRITFGEYAEAWLESRADLKLKTRHQYQSLMRQHITPTWHAVPLAKITFGSLNH